MNWFVEFFAGAALLTLAIVAVNLAVTDTAKTIRDPNRKRPKAGTFMVMAFSALYLWVKLVES